MRLEAATSSGTRRLVIERDERVGWYLYVLESGRCVMDYLQDTLEHAKEQANDEFGVAPDSWRECKG
jgi:hypothetical protein